MLPKNLKFIIERLQNIVGKEENAGYHIIYFSHNVFKRLLSQGRLKSGLCGKGSSRMLGYCRGNENCSKMFLVFLTLLKSYS